MATVTGLTAERMEEMEAATIIDGNVVAGELILQTRGGTPVNAGNVMGPTGPSGGAFHICTSTTRPTVVLGDEGKAIYETDTDLVRTWTGTRWKLQERIICTSTTRPTGLVAADEGVQIYETDTNYEYNWSGTLWVACRAPGKLEAILDDVADPGYSLCDGTTLDRVGNGTRLYAKWGTKYGVGNGSSTFNKPDFRGYTLAMVGGAIAGITGDKTGATTATAPLPVHNHTTEAHQHTPETGTAFIAENGFGGLGMIFPGSGNATTPKTALSGVIVNNAGVGGTHNNVQPTALVNWQVSL